MILLLLFVWLCFTVSEVERLRCRMIGSMTVKCWYFESTCWGFVDTVHFKKFEKTFFDCQTLSIIFSLVWCESSGFPIFGALFRQAKTHSKHVSFDVYYCVEVRVRRSFRKFCCTYLGVWKGIFDRGDLATIFGLVFSWNGTLCHIFHEVL